MNKLNYMKVVEKPWGGEYWFALTEAYLGKVIEIWPNEEISLHLHECKEETIWVQEGECKIEYEGRDGRLGGRLMKKSHSFYVNIALAIILIVVNILKDHSVAYSLGMSMVCFVVGFVLGIILTGLFMFFYNLFKPENKIKIEMEQKITAGLICAILWALLVG